jgi:porin
VPDGVAATPTSFAQAALLAAALGAVAHAPPCRAEGWPAVKDELSRSGITPALDYDGAVIANAAGGLKRGATYIGNLHLQLDLDGAALIGVPGLSVHLDGVQVHGGDPESFVGDAQEVSDWEAPRRTTLYEAWIQYDFAGERLSLLAGRFDVDEEFDRTETGELFLNNAFGMDAVFSDSGIVGPSTFPDTALGARLAYKPTPNIIIRTAVLNGAPEGFDRVAAGGLAGGNGVMVIGEVAFLNRSGASETTTDSEREIGRRSMLPPYRDKLAIGAWHYTADFADLSALDASGAPVIRSGSTGYYLIADKTLYAVPGADGKSVSAFAQAALGDGRIARFDAYFGFGLAARGFTPGRPEDEMGLGVAMARNGSHYLRAQSALGEPNTRAETAIELSYLAPIADWLAIEPDLQYVVNPDTDPALGNALVFQLAFNVSL